ncbi:MAG: 50S ribosomal protein L29 [Nitrospirota bacterium]|nr:50S ribosomal protein L29 [Nitrospirota bacterium]
MKAAEVRDLTVEELVAKEREIELELFNLRFQQAMGQLENPARIRQLRKELARLKTIAREKNTIHA